MNYTTLGYGDVVPVKRWRLLGPATAVIFDVLRRAVAYEGNSTRDP